MLQDLIPIVLNLPAEDLRIRPLADLHLGSREFSEQRWCAWRDSLLQEENTKIVIVGDMINNGIKSSVAPYDDTMSPSAQQELLYTMLEPLKDRIICGVGGNHEARTTKETDTDPLYSVFCRLKIESCYRHSTAFCILRFNYGYKGNSKMRPTYSMLVTHGTGGGVYIGSGANRVERYGSAIENLDLLISAHTHRPQSFPVGKLFFDYRNCKVLEKQFVAVVCSSMMDYGGYPLKKMLSPTGKAFQEIILSSYGKHITVIQDT